MNAEENERELERYIGERLQGLGERNAPASLMPRVLRALERGEGRRGAGWRQWPLAARAGWVAGLAVLVGMMLLGWPAGWERWVGSAGWGEAMVARMTAGWELLPGVMAIGQGLMVLWQALLSPWVIAGWTLIASMYLAVMVLGAFCLRLVWLANISSDEN
jgi:hypothetical protein